MFHAAHGMGPEPGQDNPTADNSEMVYISSLSLLKVKPGYRDQQLQSLWKDRWIPQPKMGRKD